jgi:hypothetical protein
LRTRNVDELALTTSAVRGDGGDERGERMNKPKVPPRRKRLGVNNAGNDMQRVQREGKVEATSRTLDDKLKHKRHQNCRYANH